MLFLGLFKGFDCSAPALCRRFLDPLVFGDYPTTMKQNVGSRLPAFTNLESKLVKGSFDFIGLIHYNNMYVRDRCSSLKMEYRNYDLDAAIELIRKSLCLSLQMNNFQSTTGHIHRVSFTH